MAPRGRPPKPLERIKATARDSTHKANGTELAVPQHQISRRSLVPVPPDDLGERGLVEWEKTWVAGPWLSDETDYHWVLMIAHAYDDIDAFRQRIVRDGIIVRGDKGQDVAHPLLAEIRKAEAVIMRCLSMIGFSPTDRARLGLAEVKRQSALAELRARK